MQAKVKASFLFIFRLMSIWIFITKGNSMELETKQSFVAQLTQVFLVLSLNNLLLSGSHAVMTITTIFTVRDKELIWHMGGKLGTEAMGPTSFREEQESLKSLRSLTKFKLGLEKIVVMLLFKSNSEKRYQL
jgi:hypothetical protein